MLNQTIQIALFIAWNVLILSTCVGSLWIMWREKRREPRAQWAASLRESISARLEDFSNRIDVLPDVRSKIAEVDEREKRHFASLSKQIRDNLDTDDDEIEMLVASAVHQYMRSMQQHMRAQPETPRQVAPQPAGADIQGGRPPIPGLRQNGQLES